MKKHMTFKEAFKKAKKIAIQMDRDLTASDERLSGSVFVGHQDGSFFLFDRSFVVLWEEFAIVVTEHFGTHCYPMDDLKNLRAMGPRIHIERIES